MDLRTLINKLDRLTEAITLQDISTAIQGQTDPNKRAHILNDIAKKNNLPGLYDPISGDYVAVQYVSAEPGMDPQYTISASASTEDDIKLAKAGLIPDNASTSTAIGRTLGTTDSGYSQKVLQRSDATPIINQLYTLSNELKDKLSIKENILLADKLVEGFGYSLNEDTAAIANNAIPSISSKITTVGGKLATPLLVVAYIYQGYEEITNLPPSLSEDEWKREVTKIVSKLIADYGLFAVSAVLGASIVGLATGGLGTIAGLFVGGASGIAAQYLIGDDIDEIIDYLVDNLYNKSNNALDQETSQNIKDIQQLLVNKGYLSQSDITGTLDQSTAKALKDAGALKELMTNGYITQSDINELKESKIVEDIFSTLLKTFKKSGAVKTVKDFIGGLQGRNVTPNIGDKGRFAPATPAQKAANQAGKNISKTVSDTKDVITSPAGRQAAAGATAATAVGATGIITAKQPNNQTSAQSSQQSNVIEPLSKKPSNTNPIKKTNKSNISTAQQPTQPVALTQPGTPVTTLPTDITELVTKIKELQDSLKSIESDPDVKQAIDYSDSILKQVNQ